MPIENILAAWWNPIGDMSSLTSISASDLIWQMDTYFTISYDRCARQWSAGCCHFEFRNKTPLLNSFSPVLDPLDLPGFVCYLWDVILIEFTGMLAMLKTLKLNLTLTAEAKWKVFSFEDAVWPSFCTQCIWNALCKHITHTVWSHDSHSSFHTSAHLCHVLTYTVSLQNLVINSEPRVVPSVGQGLTVESVFLPSLFRHEFTWR